MAGRRTPPALPAMLGFVGLFGCPHFGRRECGGSSADGRPVSAEIVGGRGYNRGSLRNRECLTGDGQGGIALSPATPGPRRSMRCTVKSRRCKPSALRDGECLLLQSRLDQLGPKRVARRVHVQPVLQE